MTDGLMKAMDYWFSAQQIKKLSLFVHNPLREQGKYVLLSIDNKTIHIEQNCSAFFRLKGNHNTLEVALIGRGEPICASEPYDEEKLIKSYDIIKERKAALIELKGTTLSINIIIALNKKLVKFLFPTIEGPPWILSKYDLLWNKLMMNDCALLEIQLAGMIGQNNSKSELMLGEEKIGSIYFSRKKL